MPDGGRRARGEARDAAPDRAPAAAADRFELVGGHSALDFTNTASWETGGPVNDRLGTYDDVVAWGRAAGVLSAPEAAALGARGASERRRAADSAARARALRGTLHELFSAAARGAPPPAAPMRAFNAELRDAAAELSVAWEGGRFAWRPGEARRLDLVARRVAWAAAQLLTSPDLARVRQCANAECGWLFLDTTKNRSRRWCSMRDCGSREKARRYYRRTRDAR